MKLSKRLLTIASLVDKGAKVYDVGADHGLLERYLLDNDAVSSLIAVENKIGPYNILLNNLKGYDANVYFADGLEKLDSNSDTLIFAGLGGNAIIDILKKGKKVSFDNINKIIIDAHRDKELVKRYLVSLGYKIEKEIIVFENNIFYFIISFIKGSENYNIDEYEFGYKIKNDPLFHQYCDYERNRIMSILAKKEDENLRHRLERLNAYEHD